MVSRRRRRVISGVDPLAPGYPALPTIDLIAADDSGSSSTDNITKTSPLRLDLGLPAPMLEGDIIILKNNGVEILNYTALLADVGSSTISSSPVSSPVEGSNALSLTMTRGGHTTQPGTLTVTYQTTTPTITSGTAFSVAENTAFSQQLTANRSGTWALSGVGADNALVTLSSAGLLEMIARNYESPADAGGNNVYNVTLTFTDLAGNASTEQAVAITVTNVNEAPTVANTIPDQSATVDSAFSFQFNSNTFADVDAGDTLTYSATKSDNSALPAWLAFTAGTRTFSGTPTSGDVGTLSVKVTATDSGSLTVTDTFDIVVSSFTVASLSPDLWLAADDLTTMFTTVAGSTNVASASDTVGRWEDKSGNGFHLTAMGDNTTRPTYQTSAFKNVRFDGSNDALRRAATLGLVAAGASSMFWAIKPNPGTSRTLLSETNSTLGNPFYLFGSAATAADLAGTTRNDAGGFWTNFVATTIEAGIFDNTSKVIGMVDDGSTLKVYVNGTEVASHGYTRSGTNTHDLFAIMGNYSIGGGAFINLFAGDIYELVIKKATLSAGDRASLTTYLGAKIGLTI